MLKDTNTCYDGIVTKFLATSKEEGQDCDSR